MTIPGLFVIAQLLPDVLHDVLEGGIDLVIRKVLKSLLNSGILPHTDFDVVFKFTRGTNDNRNKRGR